MTLAYSGLNGSHATIKFFPAHNIDHPLEWMVKEKLMESMKYVDRKEKGGVCVAPISPKRLVHPIQAKRIAYLDKLGKRVRLDCSTGLSNEVESVTVMARRQSMEIPKLSMDGERERRLVC